MLILGLDPGSLHTGFAFVDRQGSTLRAVEAGRISCPRTLPLPARLGQLAQRTTEMVGRCRPDLVALESTFHGVNTRSLIALSQARGALLAVLAIAGLEIVEFTPAEVKVAVTGSGRADKVQVARMVRLQIPLGDELLAVDATDALAVAICCAHRYRLDRLANNSNR